MGTFSDIVHKQNKKLGHSSKTMESGGSKLKTENRASSQIERPSFKKVTNQEQPAKMINFMNETFREDPKGTTQQVASVSKILINKQGKLGKEKSIPTSETNSRPQTRGKNTTSQSLNAQIKMANKSLHFKSRGSVGEIRNGFENMFGAQNNTSEDYQLSKDKIETNIKVKDKKPKREALSVDKHAPTTTEEGKCVIINATFGGDKKFLPQ